MSGCEGYGALARFYDKLNSQINYSEWADFIEECFRRYLPSPPDLVLDLACGTGSMTLELARRGYDMIGIDGSEDMLSEAFGRTSGQNVLLLQQDMRSFELYGTVGAVTCCLDSLNYLLGDGELSKCFSLVHNYLDPNGLFLFDMNTPYKFSEVYGSNAYVLEDELTYPADPELGETEDTVSAIFCGWQNEFHPETGICDFYLSLFEEGENGAYFRSDEHQRERCYSLEEIKNALSGVGLELLGVFSDLSFSPVTPDCERWYFAARAIKN
jgi:SAM-dependent methyltransferase